jgi:hypothetical protein
VQQIRDAIAAKIAGVAGSGLVQSYERYADDLDTLKAVYVADGQVRGWIIQRRTTARNIIAVGRWVVSHLWQIRLYMALDDAARSELAFDDLIEEADHAFRDDDTFGELIATTRQDNGLIGLQLDDSGPVRFAGVLCHGARCSLQTRHFE